MTMNNDFDEGPNGPPNPDDEFRDTPSFKDVWANSPMLKVLTLGAGVVVVIGMIMLFGGNDEVVPSAVRGAQEVVEAPGAAVDPQYEQALAQADRQRLDAAMQTQGSALPTPRGALDDRTGLGGLTPETTKQDDPLEQWRRRAEEREKQRQEARAQQEQVVTRRRESSVQQQAQQDNSQAIQQTAEGMAAQMRQILEARQIKNSRSIVVTSPEVLKANSMTDEASFSNAAGLDGDSSSGTTVQNIIIPAGEVFYGQMVTTANSKVPGPIMANIYSGPMRGARMLGSFEKTETNLLVLTFDKIVIDGIDYQIEAIAVDPQTVSPGLATEVDYHLLTRVILPGAAAFIEGLGQAYAQQENTIAIQGDSIVQSTPELNTTGKLATGISEMAGVLGEVFQDESDKVEEPTVIVGAGTPVGILFLEALTD